MEIRWVAALVSNNSHSAFVHCSSCSLTRSVSSDAVLSYSKYLTRCQKHYG